MPGGPVLRTQDTCSRQWRGRCSVIPRGPRSSNYDYWTEATRLVRVCRFFYRWQQRCSGTVIDAQVPPTRPKRDRQAGAPDVFFLLTKPRDVRAPTMFSKHPQHVFMLRLTERVALSGTPSRKRYFCSPWDVADHATSRAPTASTRAIVLSAAPESYFNQEVRRGQARGWK
jgi:hypothetical protein